MGQNLRIMLKNGRQLHTSNLIEKTCLTQSKIQTTDFTMTFSDCFCDFCDSKSKLKLLNYTSTYNFIFLVKFCYF